ncbi:MAG: hypothetical protein ABIM50_09325 [Novosphingobium sp.]
MTGFTDADVLDQSGKCFLVTGANTGIGFEAAKVLARKGAALARQLWDVSIQMTGIDPGLAPA